jgi:hypothetical protein
MKMRHEEKERMIKMPTDNKRFHASEGVCPQTGQCKFGSLYPATGLVEAATTLGTSGIQRVWTPTKRRRNFETWKIFSTFAQAYSEVKN